MPSVSLTPVANLPPVSTTQVKLVANLPPASLIPVANFLPVSFITHPDHNLKPLKLCGKWALEPSLCSGMLERALENLSSCMGSGLWNPLRVVECLRAPENLSSCVGSGLLNPIYLVVCLRGFYKTSQVVWEVASGTPLCSGMHERALKNLSSCVGRGLWNPLIVVLCLRGF